MFKANFLIAKHCKHIKETFQKPSFYFYGTLSHFILSFNKKRRHFGKIGFGFSFSFGDWSWWEGSND